MSSDRQRGPSGRRRSSAELRAEIEGTRARLAADIEAVRTKFSARGLQHEAFEVLRGARSEASGAMHDLSSSADGQVSELGRLAVDTVKRYPLVTTAVGLGLALLALGNGRKSRSPSHDRANSDLPVVRPTARADLPPSTS